MGPILAIFLAALGATLDGDALSWSIAGTPPAGVGGLLSRQGHGISGSHNSMLGKVTPLLHDVR